MFDVIFLTLVILDWMQNANPKTPIEETVRVMTELQK
jgi:hypothetical protein